MSSASPAITATKAKVKANNGPKPKTPQTNQTASASPAILTRLQTKNYTNSSFSGQELSSLPPLQGKQLGNNVSVAESTIADPHRCTLGTLLAVHDTDKGLKLMVECFEDISGRDYQMTVIPIKDGHRATVSMATINSTMFTVMIPSEGQFGLRFGTCTCGKPAKDSVPCKHMVVVIKSRSIEGLSRIQIMPYWWTTVH